MSENIKSMQELPAGLEHELKRQKLFEGVEIDTVMPILRRCPVKPVKKGDILIRAGEGNYSIHLILAGRFRVHLPNDMITPVTVLEAGQSVGEISIIDRQSASATVIADIDSRILTMDEGLFWECIKSSHSMTYNMLLVLAQRLRNGNAVIMRIKDILSEYEYNATIDPLTSLYNRRWLDKTLGRVMHRCMKNMEPLSVLMIDIDFFKQYNDRHGHLAGDFALRTVSRIILENLRPKDLVTRYGGEELFALLPGLDIEATRPVAERLRTSVNDAAIRMHGEEQLPSLTVSIGIAEMQDGNTPEQLINIADEALYRAKHAGRNVVRS